MKSTTGPKVILLGGIVGFRFSYVAQRLGAEWELEPHLVTGALWESMAPIRRGHIA